MSRLLRTLAPVACLAVGSAVALATPAAAIDRSVDHFQDVIGSCGPDDDLVADFTIRGTATSHRDREQYHLHLTGSITRTGTGVTGKYAETQLDTFHADGAETYSGSLSRLVVAGRSTYRAAGHVTFSSDGEMTFTPGTGPLVEGDYETEVCTALS